MSARNLVFNLLKDDPILNGLGINDESLFGSQTVDSPASRITRWVFIRWGVSEAPLGRDTETRPVPMSLWAYNRQRDFTPIDAILLRCRQLLLPLASTPCPGGGFFVQADYAFSSEDLYDDAYQAVMRGDTYRAIITKL